MDGGYTRRWRDRRSVGGRPVTDWLDDLLPPGTRPSAASALVRRRRPPLPPPPFRSTVPNERGRRRRRRADELILSGLAGRTHPSRFTHSLSSSSPCSAAISSLCCACDFFFFVSDCCLLFRAHFVLSLFLPPERFKRR